MDKGGGSSALGFGFHLGMDLRVLGSKWLALVKGGLGTRLNGDRIWHE
jgi:hypothetical protein